MQPITRRDFIGRAAAGAAAGLLGSRLHGEATAAVKRPNILWIVAEDMSPDFGCYGQNQIQTPHVDGLAARGVRFSNAVVTAPVCSASRSALITGMYQTAIGAHHHRSGRGALTIDLPAPVQPLPVLFRAAGYHVLNLNAQQFLRGEAEVRNDPAVGVAKTDYNFGTEPGLYDRVHWTRRPAGAPFFAQVQLTGGKYRGQGNTARWPERVARTLGSRTAPAAVALPPDLPDEPVIREDYAQYLDTARVTDWEVGAILQRLEAAGERESTVVFFITDHGISHVRHKQFLYDGGIRIPLIVAGPGVPAGAVRPDPVEHIDLAAASLAMAGIPKPDWMQSRDILADDYLPRRYVFSARDRCDETVDRIRSVRGSRWKYIRNGLPERPYLQPNAYKDNKPIVQAMRRLHAEGRLTPAQARIMALRRPAEEFYDLEADPYELRNLAADGTAPALLQEYRDALDRWMIETNDHGRQPESPAMYDSDMAPYAKDREEVQRNIAQMRRWAAEGK